MRNTLILGLFAVGLAFLGAISSVFIEGTPGRAFGFCMFGLAASIIARPPNVG